MKKAKGPIRIEAVAPFTLVILVLGLYFTLFFDLHLRKAVEWIGTMANGAEVNVGRLRTSFWNASFEMNDIEVTDVDQPQRNQLEIGQIRLELLWDALLRAKFVMADASMRDIQIQSERKRVGRVLKKAPQVTVVVEEGKKPTVTESTPGPLDKQFQSPALGDLAGLLGGATPQQKLEDLKGALSSVTKAQALKAELASKKQIWEKRLKELPGDKALQDLKGRLEKIEIPKNFSDTAKLKEAGKQLKEIFAEVEGQGRQIQETADGLQSDLSHFADSIKSLDELSRQDLKDLEKRMQLPQLDAHEIAKSVFGQMLLQKLAKYQHYLEMARQYLPAKSETTASIKPPDRHAGRTYQFGRPNSYPLFWLKSASISSQATPQTPRLGNLNGELRDATSDPPLIGKPFILKFDGDFPAQKVMGIHAELLVDHTTTVPIETLEARVASYPLAGQSLAQSEQIQLGFSQAVGQSELSAQMKSEHLNFRLQNRFAQIGFDLKAQNEIAQQVLSEILKGIPQVSLNAHIEGNWEDLRIDLNSNLGEEIARGLQKQLQAKLDEARKGLQSFLDQNLKGPKDELQKDFSQAQSLISGQLAGKKTQVEGTKKVADDKTKAAENSGKEQLKEAGKKGLDELKKKFGF